MMQPDVIAQMVSTFGIGGIFIYLYIKDQKRRNDAEQKWAATVEAREQRLVQALEDQHNFIRTTLHNALMQSTQAMLAVSDAMRERAYNTKDLEAVARGAAAGREDDHR